LSAYSRVPTLENKSIYTSYHNIYNRSIRLAKKLFFDREFHKHRSNLKKTWELIKFALNSDSKKQNFISELFAGGIHHTDALIIANKLNEFFISAPQKIAENIPHSNLKIYTPVSEKIFSINQSPVTRTEISDAIKQLLPKKSEDLFGLSMYFIKQCSSLLVDPLYFIAYKSFESGKFPSQLKIAKIIPIHKNGDKSLPDNYRPISLLPNFSKILEKVMSNRLTNFLESNSLLCKEQFGFRKSHSTLHPLINFLNKIATEKNNNKFTIGIFCDLKKAFDTVNHGILLKKLHNIGVRGIELDWFRDYLSNRKQFVHINGQNSSMLEIVLGVPQGSILGPLLFLIYINDLPSCNNFFNSLFADDTMLLDSHEDLQILTFNVNREFQKVISYFNANRMALHLEKTKFILFFKKSETPTPMIVFNYNEPGTVTNNPSLIYPMSCINDLPVPSIKFLGVQIDPQLNFKTHISSINKKLCTGLFFLRSVQNFMNEKALKYMYYSLIHCHIIYALHVYSSASEKLLKSIFVKQKQAIRIITGNKYNSHTEPLFKKLKILPFPQLCDFFRIQFMHDFKYGFLPPSFDNMWTTNRIRRQDQVEIELRNDDLLFIPFTRSDFILRMPLHLFPKCWNDFENEDLKFIRNKIEFNLKLKDFLLEKLSATINCRRLLCPSCHL